MKWLARHKWRQEATRLVADIRSNPDPYKFIHDPATGKTLTELKFPGQANWLGVLSDAELAQVACDLEEFGVDLHRMIGKEPPPLEGKR